MPLANLRSAVLASTCVLLCVLFAGLGTAQDDGSAPLTIQTHSLTRGFVSQTYHLQLEAQNGTTPYKWLLSSGSLPKGLSLSEGGVLSGIPEESGQFSFEATVTDSERPAQQRSQQFSFQVLAPLLAKWARYPKANGQRIDGSLKVSNQSDDSFDLTVVVLAVNEIGRATALGYQHFTLEKNTIDQEIPFGEHLPTGSYQVNADVVAEVAASGSIHRARLVSSQPLQLVQEP